MPIRQSRLIVLMILLFLAQSAVPVMGASQADVAAFYEGKRMVIIVPTTTGGGYDVQARMLAPFLAKYLKVKPIIKNIPGGGQLIGDNELYRSDPDGLTIGYLPVGTLILSEVGEAPGRAFETLKFSWIAQAVNEPYVVYGRKDLPPFEKMITEKKPLIYGSATDLTAIVADVTARLFNLPWKIVKGFTGTPDVYISMVRGEIQTSGVYTSAVTSLIKTGEVKVLLVIDTIPWNRNPELPTLVGLGASLPSEKLKMAKALTWLMTSSRGIAGPPGIPKERLLFLRNRVNDALNDAIYLQKFEKVAGEKLTRKPLDQYLDLLSGAVKAPPDLRVIIKTYFSK